MHDDSIATPGLAHRAMAPELDLIADLMGGTAAMQRAGQRWLPREANESWTAWRARLHRSVLFNGMARTVQALAGRPFARPVALADANPALAKLAALLRLLTRHEGRRPFPYLDTAGKLTIGVGRNLTDRGLSSAEIDLLLANDIAAARAACRRLFGDSFDGASMARRCWQATGIWQRRKRWTAAGHRKSAAARSRWRHCCERFSCCARRQSAPRWQAPWQRELCHRPA